MAYTISNHTAVACSLHMKKLLLIVTLVLGTAIHTYCPAQPTTDKTVKTETYVYLCNSKTAYVYHSSTTCRGLSRCTHGLIKVTLSDAIKVYNRKACKLCE